MRKLGVLGVFFMFLSLVVATGCSKKVTSAPAETSAAAGLTDEQLKAQQQAEMQRKAIDTIGANRIYFAFDKSDLTEESRKILSEKAELLKNFAKLSLLVEGNCDERGTNEYNMALGERRARAAYDYLVLMGIDPSRLNIISYGEEQPAMPGQNEEAWAKNRRDEFKATAN